MDRWRWGRLWCVGVLRRPLLRHHHGYHDFGESGQISGGGVFVGSSSVVVTGSSIFDNESSDPSITGGDDWGGGVAVAGSEKLSLINTTVSGNQGAGVVLVERLRAFSAAPCSYLRLPRLAETTEAESSFPRGRRRTHSVRSSPTRSPGPTAGRRLYSGYSYRANSIDSDGTCGDLPSADPMLGPLQDNGGPTWTHALLPGSPAIDAIPVADCTYDDDQDG